MTGPISERMMFIAMGHTTDGIHIVRGRHVLFIALNYICAYTVCIYLIFYLDNLHTDTHKKKY
jgi:hypothetical protein